MKAALKRLTMMCASFGLLMFTVGANATPLDLTTAGSSGFIQDAFFSATDVKPTGTGYINPFLRVGTNEAIEQGYNTDAKKPPFDDKAGIWTHSLQLQDLVSTSDGYYKFLLDINQTGTNPALDLIDVRLFLGGTGNSDMANFSELGTQVWAFGATDVVHMNYLLNPGSGGGDVYMYIPTSYFTGSGTQYLTLYSKFDLNNDGFEEWATITGSAPPVPEPGTMILLGAGFLSLAIYGKRRRNNV